MTAGEILGRVTITEVWEALGGSPPRFRRASAFWRETKDLNVSLNDEKGAWYDHARGEGGGVLDLVQHAHGGSRADALAWIAQRFGLPLKSGRAFTPAERAEYARRRRLAEAQARPLARTVWYWRQGRIAALEDAKREAIDGEHLDFEVLAMSARALYRFENLDAESLVRGYLAAVKADPVATAAVVKTARAWANACRVAVGAVVRKIEKEQTVPNVADRS